MYRKSGQTVPRNHKRMETTSKGKSLRILRGLRSDRAMYDALLDAAYIEGNSEKAAQWRKWVQDCDEAIAQHEAIAA